MASKKIKMFPLSYTQRSIWAHQEIYPESNAYNIPVLFKVETGEIEVIRRVIRSVIQKHEVLQTVFSKINDMPFQTISLSEPKVDIQLINQSDPSSYDIICQFVREPFDIIKGPMYRFAVVTNTIGECSVLMVFHHLITDGTSLFLLSKEIRQRVSERFKNNAIEKIAISKYHGSIINRNNYLISETALRNKEYWIKKLSGELAEPLLPYDYVYNSKDRESSSQKITIDEQFREKLVILAKSYNSSIYNILFACFNILMYRLSGQGDILIGSPVTNRDREELQAQGLFLNTIILRNNVHPQMYVHDLIRATKNTLMEAFRHKAYPIGKILTDLELKLNPGTFPITNVFFNGLTFFENDIAEEAFNAFHNGFGLDINFDLNSYIGISEKKILIRFDYRKSLFKEDTIKLFLSKYHKIIELVCHDTGKKICEIDYFTSVTEKKPINDAYWYYNSETIIDVFKKQAIAHSDNIAVRYKNIAITYKKLNDLTNQLANSLIATTNSQRVGICVAHNHNLATAVLGVLKAGKSYVSLDIAHPDSWKKQIIKEVKLSAIIVDSTTEVTIAAICDNIKFINIEKTETQSSDNSFPNANIEPNTEAYIIFTSGTSGKPKGVIQKHKNVLHFVSQYTSALKINASDSLTGFSPITYDSFNNDFWGSILNGATYCPLPVSEYASIDIHFWLASNNITIWHSVPGLFRMYAEEWQKSKSTTNLRIVKMSGEAVRVYDFELFKNVTNKSALFAVSLGSAESTLSSINLFNHSDSMEKGTMPAGFSLDRTDLFIWGEYQEQKDIMEPGEIVIQSDYLASAYFDNIELSNNVFQTINNKRYYFTGDLGIQLQDSRIEWIGRKDDQIKLNGIRIEVGAIEHYLLSYMGGRVISEAVVLVKHRNLGEKYLCCYYSSERPIPEHTITLYLIDRLPKSHIPSLFMWISTFPRSLHGKVDKKALPDPEIIKSREIRTANDELEEKLISIWGEVLNKEKNEISITDNFFELGGQSLKAIQLIHRIHKALNRKIELKEIFSSPTIIQQAIKIAAANDESLISIEIIPIHEDYELSRAQQRLWVLSQLTEASMAYNISMAVEIKGIYQQEYFKDALETLTDRHEILRTVFVEKDGEPRQKVLSAAETEFFIEYINLSDHLNNTEEAISILNDKANKPFQLDKAPLFRVIVVKISEQKHMLLFTIHHIVSDGWSMEIMVKEVMKSYNDALLKQNREKLAPLRIQYKDFANWHNKLMQSTDIIGQREYWLKQFSGELPVLDLPIDHPRPSKQTFSGRLATFQLNSELTRSIQDFTKNYNGTLFITLLSLVKTVLHRYTGQDDIIIGTALAGRDHIELENQVGFYVNTLALRTRFEENDTFLDLVTKVKATTLEAFKNSLYPFDYLVQNLNVERDLTRNPLFDVMVVMKNTMGIANNVLQFGGENISYFPLKQQISQFDLSFNFEEVGQIINFSVNYNTDLYEERKIILLIAHFQSIANILIKDPSTVIKDFDYLSEEEKHSLLHVFNSNKKEIDQTRTVYHFLDEWAKKTPERQAISYQGKHITYNDLSLLSVNLAKYLSTYSISRNDAVGIMMERSIDMVICILSLWRLGCCYVPISVTEPENRVNQLASDAQISYLLTNTPTEVHCNCTVINLNIWRIPVIDCEISDDFDINQPSYIIFTSGSTGKPKGALIEHLGMMNHLFAKIDLLALNVDSTVAHTASHTFDISVWQFFIALVVGGKTVIYSNEEVKDIDLFTEKINTDHIKILELVPSYLNIFCRISDEKKMHYPYLSALLVCGEALNSELAAKWLNLYPAIKFINAYGPTEASIDITHQVLNEMSNTKIVPIGKPIQNANIYIVNKAGRLCSVGCKGEIWVSGVAVGRGYINDAFRTQQSFIVNPFLEGEHSRLYKTGDIGCWTQEGNILFFGRKDHQVKIRGFRIEPGEIENYLNKFEGIKTSVVVAREGKQDEKYLCAYYTSDTEISEHEMVTYLRQNLPHYMVPPHLIRLPIIPTTTSGKVDRQALPAPENNSKKVYVAPNSAIEKALVNIWKELLNVDKNKISISDNFFEIGGNSLTVARLVHKISNKFHVQLPYIFIYNNPYIYALQEFIVNATVKKQLDIVKAEEKECYEATPAQRSLFNFQKLNEQSTVYNVYAVLKVKHGLNSQKLEQHINKLIYRHESLRTYFIESDGRLYQKVINNIDFKLKILELSNFNEAQDIHHFITPFNLNKAPLLDIYVIRTNHTVHLILNTHHIVCDGISISVLIDEINKLSTDVTLPKLKFQFKDYSEWYHSESVQEVINAQGAYWHKVYQDTDLPKLTLPLDFRRQLKSVYKGSRETFVLNNGTLSRLKAVVKGEQSTLFSLIFSVFNVFLNKITSQRDLVVGIPVSGRNNSNVDGLIGMFVNTLAIRTPITPSDSFSKYHSNFNSTLTEALNNQDYPLGRLMEIIKPKAELNRGALFDVMFVYNNYKHYQFSLNGDVLDAGGNSIYNTSKFDLTLYCEQHDNNVSLAFIYNSKLFRKSTIMKFKDYFNIVLKQIIENEDIPLSRIKIISDEEKLRILHEFNPNSEIAKYDSSIYQKVYNEWLATPKKIIAQFYDTEISIHELLIWVDLYSKKLLDEGCKNNDVIAVFSTPSIDLLIGVLAINKIGGCILPVDPDLPQKRIQHILTDSKPIYILTDEIRKEAIKSKYHRHPASLVDQNNYVSDFGNFTIPDHAYIVYTSGTTGTPKGVLVRNESLINYLNWFKSTTNITKDDATILLSSFSFDLCYTSFYSALYNGQKIHILNRVDYLNTEYLLKYIAKHKITYIKLTPSHLNYFIKYKDLYKNTFLKWVIIGGEKIKISDIEELYHCKSDILYMNHYGPAETTIGTVYEVIDTKRLNQYRDKIIIGKPINNNQVFILDEDLNILPAGIKGELCVAGIGVSSGYLNSPYETNKKFTHFYEANGQIIYRTGDYAQWLTDGRIEFIGREDKQIKLNGYRVEIAEIEALASRYPGIRNSVALLKEIGNKETLAMYFIAGEEIDIKDLQQYLSSHLPFYMIPGFIRQVQILPITTNGKIDIKKLPEPVLEQMPKNGFSDIEYQIKEIIVRLLKLNEEIFLERETNFFELGGDSVTAIQLINLINKAYNKFLSFKDVYQNGSIKELALLLTGQKESPIKLVKATKKDLYKISASQKRMYIENHISPQSLNYNKVYIIRFIEEINFGQIKAIFKFLIDRHIVFRTTYQLIDNDVYQKAHQFCPVDISHGTVKDGELNSAIKSFCKPFELDKLPLIRLKYLTIDDSNNMLLIDTHHITTDGVSMAILIKEFIWLLSGNEISDVPFNYLDYTEWLSELYGDLFRSKHRDFWSNEFNEPIRPVSLPFQNLQNNSPARCRQLHIEIDIESFVKINDFVKTQKLTHYSFFLTFFCVLLKRVTKTENLFMGLILDGRNISDIVNMVGMFVNTLPFKCTIHEHQSLLELFEEINGKVSDYYEMQTYPLQDIASDYRDKVNKNLLKNLNVFFEFSNYTSLLDDLQDKIIIENYHSEEVIFDFILRVSTKNESYIIQIEYSDALYTEQDVRTFLNEYDKMLKTFLQNGPEISVSDFINKMYENIEKRIDISFDL